MLVNDGIGELGEGGGGSCEEGVGARKLWLTDKTVWV